MEPMTKTYTQLIKQIESLKAEAERARRREMDGVISRIRSAITAYDLTAEDLGFSNSGASRNAKTNTNAKAQASDGSPAVKRRRRRGTGPAPKPARDIKFSNGSGGTWGGRGKRPQWLRDALNQGKSLEDFLVK
jgi:DNA-binding protein H-NS